MRELAAEHSESSHLFVGFCAVKMVQDKRITWLCLFVLIMPYSCHSLYIEIKIVLFYSSYRKMEKIHSLHDAVQELCDKSEDSELNESFFSDKLDDIRNKFKRVSDCGIIQYITMQHVSEFQAHSVNGSSPIKIILPGDSENFNLEWDCENVVEI